jgi:hemerythrin
MTIMSDPVLNIKWHDQMSVGIPEIDVSHQHFVDLVNEFSQAIAAGVSLEATRQQLSQILAEARAHFAHEEELFRQWRYPDYEDHATQHARIIRALQDVHDNTPDNELYAEWIAAGMEIMLAMINHILKEDMKYAGFYRARLGRQQY